LWREKNADTISKYAYLLDFFEDESWLDQVVQIVLRRRDLGEEGRVAFLAALEGSGVDVTSPLFSRLFPTGGGPLAKTLPALLDRGDEGVISFVEDFLHRSPEGRSALIDELPSVTDPRVLSLMEILYGVEDASVKRELIATLGRVRCGGAVRLLERIARREEEEFSALTARSLRRLYFLGVKATGEEEAARVLPFHDACASPPDSAGYQVVWLSRPIDNGSIVAVYFQLHDETGINAVWGTSSLTPGECGTHATALAGEEGTMPVAPAYALRLVRDALHRSREEERFLPAEFYVWRRYFDETELAPLACAPSLPDGEDELAVAAWHGHSWELLLEDDYFVGWIMANHRVYDLAEEWLGLEKKTADAELTQVMDAFLKRACTELLEPEMERLQGRLVRMTDFMTQTGRDADVVEKTRAVARSLALPRAAGSHHPFLRRYALDSLEAARDALNEGYDVRRHYDDGDDAEWD
ncbi:MAG TPA: HEAT repeat domain-containing protein, partial [Geobacteraceae bacterium]